MQPLRSGWLAHRRRRGQKNTAIKAHVSDHAEFAPAAVTDGMSLKAPTQPAARSAQTCEAALESLAGGFLADRFHSWRGRSGRRYICSVFPVEPAEFEAGLPDFADAVVIAVARGTDGSRRLVSACQCEVGANPYARESFAIEALAGGAAEWHVHLLATEPAQRQAVVADIEAMRRGSFRRTETRDESPM